MTDRIIRQESWSLQHQSRDSSALSVLLPCESHETNPACLRQRPVILILNREAPYRSSAPGASKVAIVAPLAPFQIRNTASAPPAATMLPSAEIEPEYT